MLLMRFLVAPLLRMTSEIVVLRFRGAEYKCPTIGTGYVQATLSDLTALRGRQRGHILLLLFHHTVGCKAIHLCIAKGGNREFIVNAIAASTMRATWGLVLLFIIVEYLLSLRTLGVS